LTCYSERLDDALMLVTAAFRSRRRKGSGAPYLTHLLQVMVTVAEHGGDEDQLIAALLHDYLEDIEPGAEPALRARFGDVVTDMVVALTETTDRRKPPWQQRKEAYIERVRGAPPAVKLIGAADKLHNAATMTNDLRREGPGLWQRFGGSREQTLWFYREVLAALSHGWSHPVLGELAAAVARLEDAATPA
jgi:(p)ppGpp synthase/HD superfamily hydrolase